MQLGESESARRECGSFTLNVENLQKKAADKKKSAEFTIKRHARHLREIIQRHAENVELLNSNIKEWQK